MSYTQAVLASTRVLIDRNKADRAHTAALIAELRSRIATSWEMLREIQQPDPNSHYRSPPRADPLTADAERDGV